MHPLWNLLPTILCAAILAAASYCLIDETRADRHHPNPWLLAALTATVTASAIAAAISVGPVIAWTLGALS